MLFYTQLFTSKRGPLAKIWLAAHWERKLTKAHVFECNLETTIKDIISPKVKLGLRTSGHLLLGVVRIYSRKAKYLLADCNDALLKIKVVFRPGQTDLPKEGLEATLKTITLTEDFTSFDAQLPSLSDIDVEDHFSLNQSRFEEITLREDFGNVPNVAGSGSEAKCHQNAVLDVSLQSFTQEEDGFGDEDKAFDLFDFLKSSSDPAESNDFIPEEPQNEDLETSLHDHQLDADRREQEETATLSMNETTLLSNEEEAFALEPVPITPNKEKRKAKRKRRLVVDMTKELTNEFIREQLTDYSDLLTTMDMAPPTVQLMQWKDCGGADKLFAQPCSNVPTPQIKELFAKSVFNVKYYGGCDEVEDVREDRQEVQEDVTMSTRDNITVRDSSNYAENTHNTELQAFDEINNNQDNNYSALQQDKNRSECTCPELPSEDSMFVHPSQLEQETQSTSLHTQSMRDSQDFVERRINMRAQKLLNSLKTNSDTTFSVRELCEGTTRFQAANTFFCLLVLKKQQALHLHQSAPYEDITITQGPKFYDY